MVEKYKLNVFTTATTTATPTHASLMPIANPKPKILARTGNDKRVYPPMPKSEKAIWMQERSFPQGKFWTNKVKNISPARLLDA